MCVCVFCIHVHSKGIRQYREKLLMGPLCAWREREGGIVLSCHVDPLALFLTGDD